MKKCKYCMTKIDEEAKVCPNCKRVQNFQNNPLWLIPIFSLLFFFAWCCFSNNAPDTAKEIFCGLGIRKGSYCRIETGEYEIKVISNWGDTYEDF